MSGVVGRRQENGDSDGGILGRDDVGSGGKKTKKLRVSWWDGEVVVKTVKGDRRMVSG